MTDITIPDSSLPSLTGKHAVVTGGASGIGLACVNLLASLGASVYVLDIKPPEPKDSLPENTTYINCDISSWPALRSAFSTISRVDYVFANAGQGQAGDPLAPISDDSDDPPFSPVIDTNYRAALHTAMLGIRSIRAHGEGGSIVFTASSTAISAQHGLPIYGSLKLALLGLVRTWRVQLIKENITVNAVAPAATITNLLPAQVVLPLADKGLQVSKADHVARALVFSAVGREQRRVEAYASEREEDNEVEGRWNGRCIFTIADRYTEIEEPLERLKVEWLGKQNLDYMRLGQRIIEAMSGGR